MDFTNNQAEEFESEQMETKPENAPAASAGETKAEKFKRLAPPRINKAVHAIELIGNLAGSSYEYTDEEVNKMFDFLQNTLDETKNKFTKTVSSKEKFTF